jgi:hypothetical protein
MPFFPLELGNELISNLRSRIIAPNFCHLPYQLRKRDLRVYHHGLHGRDLFHTLVELHRIA